MRRDQLADARRGVDLLLAHLKGSGDALDAALAARDVDACEKCADPLVTITPCLKAPGCRTSEHLSNYGRAVDAGGQSR
jgi:hypothetical protein